MKKFMDENFLLETKTAENLYHNYAKKMPIFDYHSHISVKDIYEDKKYENITQIWLYTDHYKWRAMRLLGVDECFITGDASDFDKFMAYAKALPYLIGNPLYHWSHLELKRYFGIDEQLNEKTAEDIWDKTKKVLNEGLSARRMISDANVAKVCSTDDPIDSLKDHQKLNKDDSFKVEILPTFRPDKGIDICGSGFSDWVSQLGIVCGLEINDYKVFLDCISKRIDYFNNNGCVMADHALEKAAYAESTWEEASEIFKKALSGEKISDIEEAKYQTFTTVQFAEMYNRIGWTMQLHFGAMRDNNTKMFNEIGQNTGFDSVSDYPMAVSVSRLLDKCNDKGLPKTLVFTINPKDNYALGTMMGNFAEKGTRVQFGCAWWFNDQRDGIQEHLKVFGNTGALPRFVGMLTDSRNFLSYTRHEYFRRILCNIIGSWVEKGEYPFDMETLGKIVQDISYNNAVSYFEKL